MLHVACCLWDANNRSAQFSKCYDESWVEKLHSAFRRNLTREFQFVVFTDKDREFSSGIEQRPLQSKHPDWSCLIEPFRLNEPSIIVGLDTIILRNIDHLANYCLSADTLALPRIGKNSNNGFVLVPRNHRHIFDRWRGENDMDWLRAQPHKVIDEMWPGDVVSYKLHVRPNGMRNAKVVYFHGEPKPHKMKDVAWVAEHWR